jgi:tripartite-type tricarboxylate transporter receptor subunit TctC
MVSRRQLLVRSTGALGAWGAFGTFGVSAPAFAQTGLETARIFAGFAPGGTVDSVCRRVADKLRGSYAANTIVENRTGAGGQLAIQATKSAPPDGSTLLLTPMGMVGIYPHIYKKLPYDPVADLTPVSLCCTFEHGIAVGPAVPASVRNVSELLAWWKANPKSASYGSPGAGAMPHFIGVLLGRTAGIDLTHVPFRGTQPAVQDMLGGQIPAVCGPLGEFVQHAAAGRLRILGTSGSKRSRFTPQVATLAEQGLADLVFSEWFGFYMPPQASADVVQRLNTALRAALAMPDVVEGLGLVGLEASSSSAAELAALQKRDTERWGPIVKAIGFTADS